MLLRETLQRAASSATEMYRRSDLRSFFEVSNDEVFIGLERSRVCHALPVPVVLGVQLARALPLK